MAEISHLENRHNVIFFSWEWSDLDKISQTGAEWHVDCGDMVKIEARFRIPIRRTFGRIPWHVIPEPRITLQGAATWWIHCHDSRATCHIAGCSHLAKSVSWSCYIAGCNNSIRHIENRYSPYFMLFFVFFKMQFRIWREAAFVSSSIHLYNYRQVLGVCQDFPLGGVQGAQGQEPDLHRIFAFQWDIWRSYGRISMKFYASKITENRVHGFAWNAACRQMSEHGRTD